MKYSKGEMFEFFEIISIFHLYKKFQNSNKMDYSKEKFPLSNVVLYSKGWYKQSGDLIKDVISMLKLDGYPCANGYFDVISIVSKEYNDWNEWKHKNDMDYKDINSFIKVFLNKYSLDLFMHKRSKFLDMMLQVMQHLMRQFIFLSLHMTKVINAL